MAKMAIADQVLQRQDKDGMLRRALERIIQLYTCLLYTSPSPRDGLLYRMPSSA